jgi:hypothetical protein
MNMGFNIMLFKNDARKSKQRMLFKRGKVAILFAQACFSKPVSVSRLYLLTIE